MAPLLADTCLAIWLVDGAPIGRQATETLANQAAAGSPTLISPITAWEVGILVSRKRLKIIAPPEQWFLELLSLPGIALAELPPDILIASSFLPGEPPNDPADRIIAATARDLGATLLTRDRKLLDYARQGHLSALAC